MAQAPTDDVIDIDVFAGRSSCIEYDRVEVTEEHDLVRIDAYVWRKATDSCTEDFATHRVTVTLDQPLGDRTVVGCADERIETRGWDLPPDTDCLATVNL